jgi:hypothetical protein
MVADIIAANDTDGEPDEEIVINQTSMSPGSDSSPYDVNTHFGALWLAGAVCQAFSKGHVDAFHYWMTMDDAHHMKGLIYSDAPPPNLPYHAAGQPYQLKPMGHAMAMLTRTLLDDVVVLTSDSVEVDALLTVDAARTKASLIIVNKFPRIVQFDLDSALPGAMQNKDFDVTFERFAPGMDEPRSVDDQFTVITSDRLTMSRELDPETVYVFRIEPLDTDGDGVRDSEDAFPTRPDESADADGDGLGDNFEQAIIDDNPDDTLTDLDDVLPGDDYDGDSLTNKEEFLLRADPVDPEDPGPLPTATGATRGILGILLAASAFQRMQ